MLIRGDARHLPLIDGCVQAVVTSPPYWSLRDYGTATWDGGDTACEHKGRPKPRNDTTGSGTDKGRFAVSRGTQPGKCAYAVPVRDVCRCGARRIDAQIGLETTPEAYVAELVAVFAGVKRLLKDDGVLWLNLGDCNANDGKWGGETGGKQAYLPDSDRQRVGRAKRVTGLKPKDLVGIPWMVAFALRADGWHLRSYAPWIKRNTMPESVKDRPGNAIEALFMFTKSAKCYYDATAVMMPGAIPAGTRAAKGSNVRSELKNVNGRPPKYWEYTGTRNRRNSDWFFESWQGLLGDDQGEPLAFVVNTRPYADAHFATFPPALVHPCIQSSSRPGDLILDPFIGSGTVGAVAERLDRRWVGVDLSYHDLSVARTTQRGLRFAGEHA